MENRPPFLYQATVGIDWADRKHDVSFVLRTVVLTGENRLSTRSYSGMALRVAIRLCRGEDAIALEQRRGALFYQLCTHLNWIDLYPINPHSLSSFRLTFFLEPGQR